MEQLYKRLGEFESEKRKIVAEERRTTSSSFIFTLRLWLGPPRAREKIARSFSLLTITKSIWAVYHPWIGLDDFETENVALRARDLVKGKNAANWNHLCAPFIAWPTEKAAEKRSILPASCLLFGGIHKWTLFNRVAIFLRSFTPCAIKGAIFIARAQGEKWKWTNAHKANRERV